MTLIRTLVFCLCCATASVSFGEMYRWVDENGRVQFSDRPNGSARKEVPKAATAPAQSTTAPPSAPSGYSVERVEGGLPSTIALRTLLRGRKFDQLNRILGGYQRAVDAEISNEDRLFAAYDAFALTQASYAGLFDAWVEATPMDSPAYLARATYRYSRGWAARGNKWASETSEQQFEEMAAQFIKSLEDVVAALEIDDRSMVAYCLLIEMAKAQGRHEEMEVAVKRALKANPVSYKVRAQYVLASTPRWGGSFEQMKAFIDAATPYVDQNPKLKLLEGLLYAEAGRTQGDIKKYSLAEELYTKALTYGENHARLMDRGKVRYWRENYEGALADFDRAIELYPEDGGYYYWRSLVYSKLERYEPSVSDIERAYQFDADDEYVNSQREWLAGRLESKGYDLRRFSR